MNAKNKSTMKLLSVLILILLTCACDEEITPTRVSKVDISDAVSEESMGIVTDTLLPTQTRESALSKPPSCSKNGKQWTSPIDGMDMVCVPAGEFNMGRDDGYDAYDNDEKPVHLVYLDTYWIDRTEVTNKMFAKFASDTNFVTDAEKEGNSWVYLTSWDYGQWVEGANWQHPQGPDSNIRNKGNHPVVHVSWNDALAYCQWAGRRLPTEAEWERAARGNDTRMFPWGNQVYYDASAQLLGNCGGRLDGYEYTSPVGNYPPGASPYGALDMVGNVSELVFDWWQSEYYVSSPYKNPLGPTSGDFRSNRGGDWGGCPSISVASRNPVSHNFRGNGQGFRCVQSSTP